MIHVEQLAIHISTIGFSILVKVVERELKTKVMIMSYQKYLHYFQTLFPSLHKLPQLHLISWRGNFVARHSFRMVSGDSPETMRKLCLAKNFHTKKLGEITVFYAVLVINLLHNNINSHSPVFQFHVS